MPGVKPHRAAGVTVATAPPVACCDLPKFAFWLPTFLCAGAAAWLRQPYPTNNKEFERMFQSHTNKSYISAVGSCLIFIWGGNWSLLGLEPFVFRLQGRVFILQILDHGFQLFTLFGIHCCHNLNRWFRAAIVGQGLAILRNQLVLIVTVRSGAAASPVLDLGQPRGVHFQSWVHVILQRVRPVLWTRSRALQCVPFQDTLDGEISHTGMFLKIFPTFELITQGSGKVTDVFRRCSLKWDKSEI